MFELLTNRLDILPELNEVVRSFIASPEQSDLKIVHTFLKDGKTGKIQNSVQISGTESVFESEPILTQDTLEYTRLELRCCKLSLYKALKGHFKRSLPWGSLTGIRPTKLAYQFLQGGKSQNNLADSLCDEFLVSRPKAELTQQIVCNQIACVNERMSLCSDDSKTKLPFSDKLYNLYIHIPFCPTKCHYCSFISAPVDKQKWLVQPYIDALCKEIQATVEQMEKQGSRIFSVYVGGGTPTSVSAEQLNQVLSVIPQGNYESTCEAGRPDTITEEKLHVMLVSGVNRISVNPQTLNEETLVRIGRKHSVESFFEAYALAKKFGFRINIDLIAGLDGETLKDFCKTLEGIIDLLPHNITVHTLSRKRGSELIQTEYRENSDIEAMVDYSAHRLTEVGYLPYYLYRQKQMLGNLENIGWTKKDMACVNNITTMEETLSVAACGAGAISKRIYSDGRIERLANVRDILLYLDQFDDRLRKKQSFFKI